MLRRNAGWAVRFVCISVLMTGPLGHPVDHREETPTKSPKVAVRQSHSLSVGEQKFILERKQIVLEALNRLEINSTLESVPHIALLASGGGQRAAVSLMGYLDQMGQYDLLDTLLYLGGVSGATWTISMLYSDPEWSDNMDSALSSLYEPSMRLTEAIAWLKKKAEEDNFSLSDVWGAVTGAGIMKQMDLRSLSDEANRPNATNPYPIYNAIEKNCYEEGPIEGKWFELTPHEAGFTELGLYVNTSSLNSGLQGGETVMDMVRLNGIMGSVAADKTTLYKAMPPWLQAIVGSSLTEEFTLTDIILNWMDQAFSRQGDTVFDSLMDSLYVLNNYMRMYHTVLSLVDLMRKHTKDPIVSVQLDSLHKQLKEKLDLNPWPTLVLRSQKEREKVLMDWSEELIKPIEKWGKSLREGEVKEYATFIIKYILPRIGRWEWGTTKNFLYNNKDPATPSCLTSQRQLNLMDAGVMINAPYPPLLGDRRDIDLMVAPDCSTGEAFGTLTLARDYAAKLKKPFPDIDENVLKEKDWPKDWYVFEGEQDQPTIIYMPLFNQKNCKDAKEVLKLKNKYPTLSMPFNKEQIDFLLNTSRTNMRNNRDNILTEIRKAVQRRRQRMSSTESSPLSLSGQFGWDTQYEPETSY